MKQLTEQQKLLAQGQVRHLIRFFNEDIEHIMASDSLPLEENFYEVGPPILFQEEGNEGKAFSIGLQIVFSYYDYEKDEADKGKFGTTWKEKNK